jgi:hypothetical protein
MTAAFFDSLSFLFRVFVVYIVYASAKHLASESRCHKAKAYLWALGVSAFLAGMSWVNYGTDTEDADPIYGGGETVVVFEPTQDQRNRHGIFIFTVIAVSSVVGTYQGLADR